MSGPVSRTWTWASRGAERANDHSDPPRHRRALTRRSTLRARITDQERWQLLDETDTVVGQLATSFRPPDGMQCRASTVLAVVGWSRESSKPKYRDTIKCDSWEVVVPELVFEPH